MKKISANIVDVLNERIFPGTITISNGKIASIVENDNTYHNYIIPGFVDAHIHIESSLLPPSEFARIAIKHGTIACVSDPHEIANVLGIEGIRFMIENAKSAPLKFYFSAPSCVPATPFETAGACLNAKDIESLFQEFPEIKHLGEMMNYPGVLHKDKDILEKLALAKKYNKPIDGHAPGLKGKKLNNYIDAGITTDHESTKIDEALEKLSLGMKILIRQGSAAKNFNDLIVLANQHYKNCMFCTDDKHPDDLLSGHIDIMVKKALESGLDIFKVLTMASVNPIKHYGLDVGLLQEGDPADFLLVNSLSKLRILKSVINGKTTYLNNFLLFLRKRYELINNFNIRPVHESNFYYEPNYKATPIIEAKDGQLTTSRAEHQLQIVNHNLVSDVDRDILKIAVINRYKNRPPIVSFVKNFGLKKGAIASSIAHDSHNIIVVGVSEIDMRNAANLIIEKKGGISVVCEESQISEILELPIAGLMSNKHFDYVAKKYALLDQLAKTLGSTLRAPFMTLSFMSLLVIPEIKLSDKGLFNSSNFTFI
jgi:adenine deaminase